MELLNRDIRHDILNDNIATNSNINQLRTSEEEEHEHERDIEYGSFVGEADKNNGRDEVGKPGSKVRRLKRMLQDAEKKKVRLEELKQQGDQGVKRFYIFIFLFIYNILKYSVYVYSPEHTLSSGMI